VHGDAGSQTTVLKAAGNQQDERDERRRLHDGVSNFERFRQRVFEELDELEQVDRQHAIESFVEYGRQHGIDVITEVVDKGRSISEVFLAMAQGEAKS